MNIYVGQLPANVNESELKELFSEYGDIASVNLVMDRFSGRPKDFGFIDMPDNSQADQAIKALNKSTYKGNQIKVNQVQPLRGKKALKRRPRY
ncbi:MAG: RNA-binding protein [Proteobacteria bacterium]|nr:RNA-binding protein [Pseudomonadota bacterium]MBU1686622.1 RNA-binding protein [Pseudomonadota bacterium]